MKSLILIALLTLISQTASSQYAKTANETIPEYTGYFTFGTNMGYPKNGKWSNQQRANLCAGNEELSIAGAGINSLRLSIPHHHMEKWGYEIMESAMEHYESLGMYDHTAFIGYPSDEKLDKTHYGTDGSSKLFTNLYEPIWDDNNGTPVNENNDLALFVYKIATKYGDKIKFWEIWNEPDFTYSGMGNKTINDSDSWWTRDPKAEELHNLKAPIQHYIRTLRVCYEVIKHVDKSDFVCIGGIGYAGFLDAVLRNSDNPNSGAITSEHPKKGGAYFDCVSYHSYPMYFLRKWNNQIKDWDYFRHSDMAVQHVFSKKQELKSVLTNRGYDGITYPEKEFIITETNIPSRSHDEYIGSEEAQINFLMKVIIMAQKNNLKSLHTYSLYDGDGAGASYSSMGFYLNLDNTLPYSQVEKKTVPACRTVMSVLHEARYDHPKTLELKLPDHIEGAAFKNSNGVYIYALWAKTNKDKNEIANATYTFPSEWNVVSCNKYNWDYSIDNAVTEGVSQSVQLSGTPAFFILNGDSLGSEKHSTKDQIRIFPNPASDLIYISGTSPDSEFAIEIFTIDGKNIIKENNLRTNSFNISHLIPGVYIVKLIYSDKAVVHKFQKF